MKYMIKHIFFLIICLGLSFLSLKAQADVKEIKGKVLSTATNGPIAGISLSVEGFSAAMTDESGDFILKVPSLDVEIDVAGPFYKSKKVASKNKTEITIY